MVASVNIVFLLGLIIQPSLAWQCQFDTDCSSLAGSICDSGLCGCPEGLLAVLGGTLCAQWSPYYTSSCYDDHQCARLFTSYQCRREGANEGSCYCLPGNHYLSGRCWRETELGESCTRDEECQGSLRDPFSMVCNGICECAAGYYLRQRGECRRSGLSVGDGCVVNEDCRFENAACDQTSFSCYNINDGIPDIIQQTTEMASPATQMAGGRQHGAVCGVGTECVLPFECSTFGSCVCPVGYYVNDNETLCFAELGSPSTTDQCVGLFALVSGGVCTCPSNFYFDVNMRDCVKATLSMTDSCVNDLNCHTFGSAARCGEPQQWGLRSCECTPDVTLWDEQRQLCRFIVGLGEPCTADSECVIGEQQVVCATDASGQGVCVCPDGYNTVGDQCFTTGLVLNDTCRDTQECTGTANAVCDGTCRCSPEYVEIGEVCAPGIGGTCSENNDCVVDSTYCEDGDTRSCRCEAATLEYEGQCYPYVSGYNASCVSTVQCQQAIGAGSSCQDNHCLCDASYHYRDGGCWPVTGLFEVCTRTSECYLPGLSDRVVCRNSLCQCEFHYPYSESLHTCTSSASAATGSVILIATFLLYLCLRF